MTDVKTFEADEPDLEAKPIPFTVTYRRLTGDEDPETGLRPSEKVTDEFRIRPFVNAGVLVWMDTMLRSPNKDATPAFDLFDAALVPRDVQRFRRILHDPDMYVDGSTIGRIAGWMYEVYTARPTQPPADT